MSKCCLCNGIYNIKTISLPTHKQLNCSGPGQCSSGKKKKKMSSQHWKTSEYTREEKMEGFGKKNFKSI